MTQQYNGVSKACSCVSVSHLTGSNPHATEHQVLLSYSSSSNSWTFTESPYALHRKILCFGCRELHSRDRLQLPSISPAGSDHSSSNAAADGRGRLAQLGKQQQSQPKPLQPIARRVTQQQQPQFPKLPLLAAGGSGSISSSGLLKPLQPLSHQRQQIEQQQQQQRPKSHRDDTEVRERTAVWTRLLLSMRSNPEAQEFVYLKYAQPNKAPLNPYDLQVCRSRLTHMYSWQ